MKKIFILSSMLFLTVCSKSFASSEYEVDDVAIEATLNKGVEVASIQLNETATPASANLLTTGTSNGLPTATLAGGKDPAVAFVLSWLLGFLGVHRFYMGTATLTGVGYILTFGGCGIVATVDWVVLLIALINKEGISKYEDNPKFFMWSGK